MEMSILRGPSAENSHLSPTPNDNKTATNEEPVVTRKCCTLCNLLVSLLF